MNEPQHSHVRDYLKKFDDAAAAVPPQRRGLLREEVETHLQELIRTDTPNDEAVTAIAEFGSPAEIIAQELEDSTTPGNSGRGPSKWALLTLAATGATALLIAAGITLVVHYGTGSGPGPWSVVNATTQGPERVKEGQAYFEYRAAIEDMTEPLPPGASYPDGVPEGLDAGLIAGPPKGVMEWGAGRHLAHFIWLCAWESEYLAAYEEKDFERQVEAGMMLSSFTDSAWFEEVGWGDAWVESVINPLKYNDPSGVQRDRTNTCAEAGIFNVRN